MGIYFPVDPIIDANGDLASIVSLYPRSGGRAKPIDLDAGQKFFSTPGFETSVLSYTTSASLKYSGFVTDSFDLESLVCVIDVTCYSESRSQAAPENIVLATRWGCGLRFFFTISDMKKEFSLKAGSIGLTSIAAAAELGLANVTYKISGIGIGFNGFLTVLDGIDPLGILTVDAAVKMSRTILNKNNFYQSITALQETAAGKRPVLSSLPLEVLLRGSFGDAGRSIPQSVVFGLRCLRDGLDLRSALEQGTNTGYDRRSIRKAYAMICNTRDQIEPPPPTATQMTIAQQWLDLKMV